jgi:putative Ca2+/H+ antiporter (TMEM165/GDT1 family)
MDLKVFATVFATVFLAELGDKTQLATLLYAADVRNPKITVFAAGAAALVLAVGLAVLLGTGISKWASPKSLSVVAGFGFIIIGVWTIVRGLTAA